MPRLLCASVLAVIVFIALQPRSVAQTATPFAAFVDDYLDLGPLSAWAADAMARLAGDSRLDVALVLTRR
jgi:hypothetical protein